MLAGPCVKSMSSTQSPLCSGSKESITRAEHPLVDFALRAGACADIRPSITCWPSFCWPLGQSAFLFGQDDSDPFPLFGIRSAFQGCACIDSLAKKATSFFLFVRMQIPELLEAGSIGVGMLAAMGPVCPPLPAFLCRWLRRCMCSCSMTESSSKDVLDCKAHDQCTSRHQMQSVCVWQVLVLHHPGRASVRHRSS